MTKTYVTEANLVLAAVTIGWLGLQLGFDVPGDVRTALALLALNGINLIIRVANKKGWL